MKALPRIRLNRDRLPTFATWSRYLRQYRQALAVGIRAERAELADASATLRRALSPEHFRAQNLRDTYRRRAAERPEVRRIIQAYFNGCPGRRPVPDLGPAPGKAYSPRVHCGRVHAERLNDAAERARARVEFAPCGMQDAAYETAAQWNTAAHYCANYCATGD